MIDKYLREYNSVEYIRLSDLTFKQQESFRKYLYGAQVPLIEGENRGNSAYYLDYRLWLEKENMG